MIEADDTAFPANVVKYVSMAFGHIDPDIRVFQRPLRSSDPRQSVGVCAQAWAPDQESLEMRGRQSVGPQMPTVQQYVFTAQAFVRDADEVRGLNVHAVLSQRVRTVLYTDPNLQLVLGSLQASLPGGKTEAVRRWGVRTSRYFANEIEGTNLYLSTLEFWVETETQ